LPELPTVNQLFDSSDNEPPVYLTGAGLEYWQGKRQKLKPDGETDKSETLIAIAYHLRNAGASVKVIAEALSNRDSALAYNKYSGRKDASRYYLDIAKHASTSIAIPDTFDRQLTSEDSQPAAVISYRRLDITELLDEETSQVNPLVYGLIYPGMLSIIGSWVGTGKTSLVMALVAALVNQENALDCLPTTSIKGNIVYFSELPKKSMSKTLRSMSLTYEVDPVKLSEKLHVYDITGDSVLIPSVAAQVKSICKNATLVVIDTFDAWFNGNPNDTAQVLEAWTLLKNIASDNSAAILVLDHQSKSKPDQKTQETAVSGSAAKQRYADLVYRLDRSDGANILTPVKDRFGVAVNLQIRKNDENKLVAFK
jgi:predicted ATP-dependent serine protease